MVAVVDLDAGAVVDVRERIGDRAQLRREFFVREACHVEPAVDKRHVGDRLRCAAARAGSASLASGAFGRSTFENLTSSRATHLDLPGAVDAQERGRRVGALSAHDRQIGVAGLGMHGEIGDGDLAHIGAEQRRDLLIDAGDRLAPAAPPCASVPSSSAKMAADCVSPAKSKPSGAERQWTNRLERRAGAGGGVAAWLAAGAIESESATAVIRLTFTSRDRMGLLLCSGYLTRVVSGLLRR